MSEQLDRKIRTARKSHTCDYCGQTIKKGEQYEWSKNIWEGTIFEWHNHLSCGRIASAIFDYVDPDDGMSDQDFCEGCQEVCQRFICPDCPKWNKEYGDCDDDLTYCIDRMDKFFETHELYRAGRKDWYEIWKCRKKARGEG
jgi:hypothetical protein